jgi:LacI family transcriptional regulator
MTLTLKQIAELASVSRSTASRVLNGYPGVRPEVRERVLQVMAEQGFQPDPAARSLALRRSALSEGDAAAATEESAPANPA